MTTAVRPERRVILIIAFIAALMAIGAVILSMSGPATGSVGPAILRSLCGETDQDVATCIAMDIAFQTQVAPTNIALTKAAAK